MTLCYILPERRVGKYNNTYGKTAYTWNNKLYLIKENPKIAMHKNLKEKKKSREHTHQKEQSQYIQGQFNEIRNSVEDRQSL